ncbi:protein-glutamate O-methyltransferase CheR [Marivirga arenosa]|uniref:protein-glutamate O-methyltransferase n=1 Tax=Marivirga arenosa TaxID=3059076 RepID=A0AA49JE50_9BACT|nr:protein-glutamate O-methyltransferase CheR [Marivirga sp. ABR2-2]WKK86643.2 protein-glutamate O-methyltransferase CheR [Marivirga sp. ABR2-2]
MSNNNNTIKLLDREYYKLSSFIHDHYGINLTDAKRVLLESRLQKRLRAAGLTNFKDYVKQVISSKNQEEIINMINVVSTNKTDFFREKSHFDYMSKVLLPEMATKYGKELKVWSAASSTGEEIYTIAMVIEEFMNVNSFQFNYSIDGTDISTDVLRKCIRGVYDLADIAPIPNSLKQKYFLRSRDKIRPKVKVVRKLRARANFYRFNLMSSNYPTKGKYDIIFCRNVLIYFDRKTQYEVIKKLCGSLKTGGYLFLGHSESIIGLDLPLQQVTHTGYRKVLSHGNA